MKPYLAVAIKNIKSNKGRTIVTILLSSISTAILVFVTAFMDGEHKIMLKNAVELYPGYIQITHKEFRDNPSYEHLIENSTALTKKLKHNQNISSLSQRFETFVLLTSDTKSVGAMISRIEPEKEKINSKLFTSLYKGEYLKEDDTNAVYLGEELAKNLKVKVGDKISFVGSGVDYSFCADNLIVKGIFQTGLFEFDATSSFVNKKYFDEVFVSKGLATHIIIYPKEIESSKALSDDISKTLDKELDSQSWEEFMSALVEGMELDGIFGYITIGIFFIVIFFVILIYTLLNVFARIKEIGILRAIGTKQHEILGMLLFESGVLSFISVIIGGIIGAFLAYYFSINPIDFGAEYEEQFKQYGIMSTAIPTDFNIVNILRDMVIMFILCISSTLYPIFKVNRFKPVEAINHV